ncbi:HlyD family type I secretion periplasmic adaptor subunit [Thiohalorhabdus methylotrophus]|uniref:Membrane fusion protein (MFP) family protein n=1 Tax=Thiohalorhabdus methylotrophus TaxID=3242694 RepID=A0ABV4TW30_9GAMM
MSGDKDESPVPAFHPRLIEVVRRPPSPKPRLMLGLLAALLVGLLVWAVIGRLDVVARAEGKLVPKGRLKIVQPFEKGRIERILVKEGDKVEEGQPLVIMDTRLTDADLQRIGHELARVRLELRRVRAELEQGAFAQRPHDPPKLFKQVKAKLVGHRRAFRNALAREESRLKKAKNDLAAAKAKQRRLEKTLPIFKASENALGKLEQKGYASHVDLLDKRRVRIETQEKLAGQHKRISALKAQVEGIQGKIRSLRSSHRKELLDERVKQSARLEELRQKKRKLDYRFSLKQIQAPEAGVVKRLATHTQGSVVSSGAVLMRLVPGDQPLQAEVMVSNSDIGFVHAGQEARLKLTAFDFQRYGTLEAEVEYLSPDAGKNRNAKGRRKAGSARAQGERYPAMLSLESQHMTDGKERLDLRAGMHVTAEIKLGTRSVLEYVLSPVTEGLKEAGQQR